MKTTDLFDFAKQGAPYQRHSKTSREAAEKIEPAMNRLQARVFDFISSQGDEGATDHEIQEALALNPSTERPRRVELHKRLQLIRDSGQRRKTPSGREATVWIVR